MLPNFMRIASRSPLYSLLCWLLVAIAPHGFAQTYQGNQLVRPEFLADTTAIVPGKSFAVGLLLRMAPGWHTYWKFSGDAGLPTELKWKLPPGWKIGDIITIKGDIWPVDVELTLRGIFTADPKHEEEGLFFHHMYLEELQGSPSDQQRVEHHAAQPRVWNEQDADCDQRLLGELDHRDGPGEAR